MSYIQLGGIQSLTSAAISLWFRVPQSTMDKCAAAYQPSSTAPFNGVIPLICIGQPGVKHNISSSGAYVDAVITYFNFGSGTFTDRDLGFTPTQVLVSNDFLTTAIVTPPTCIGVDCTGATPILSITLQTDGHAAIKGYQYTIGGVTKAIHYAGISGDGFPPGPNVDAVFNYVDASSIWLNSTEAFVGSSTGPTITADHWHHVLLSFSLGAISAIGNFPNTIAQNTTSSCRMWVALDDVNYTKFNLSDYWLDGQSDPNLITTVNGSTIAGSAPYPGTPLTFNQTDPSNYGVFNANGIPAGTPSYAFNPIIPAGPVGLPASAQFVNNVLNCEMGELQVFLGRGLDTSIVANRRLFVDDKGLPVKPTITAKALGKQTILLHGSNKWIKGKDTGTAGNFRPTGKILKYVPDPSLHGPQSPADLKK